MFSLEAGQETSARELGRAVDAGNVKPELGGGPRVVIKAEGRPGGLCCRRVQIASGGRAQL